MWFAKMGPIMTTLMAQLPPIWAPFVLLAGFPLGICYDSTSNSAEESTRTYQIMSNACKNKLTLILGDFNRGGIDWDNVTSDKRKTTAGFNSGTLSLNVFFIPINIIITLTIVQQG
jgi:hypothetical protein